MNEYNEQNDLDLDVIQEGVQYFLSVNPIGGLLGATQYIQSKYQTAEGPMSDKLAGKYARASLQEVQKNMPEFLAIQRKFQIATDPGASAEPAGEVAEEAAETPEPETATASPLAQLAAYEGFYPVAMRAVQRGDRPLPIKPGAKKPLILWKGSSIDTASKEEWPLIAEEWVRTRGEKFPDASVCVIAKPYEKLFLDEDESARFRDGYAEWSGLPFPETFTTESQPDHKQSHWLQTDKTREMGNIGQEKLGLMSVRQSNLYVLSEGSRTKDGKGTGFYRVIDDSPVVPMPDSMVEYILKLKAERAGTTQKQNDLPALPTSTTSDVGDVGDVADQQMQLDSTGVIAEEYRNSTLCSLAGKARSIYRLNAEELFRYLCIINEKRCQPPLDESEVRTIANSVSRYDLPAEVLFNGQPSITDAIKEQFITGVITAPAADTAGKDVSTDPPRELTQADINAGIAAGVPFEDILRTAGIPIDDIKANQQALEKERASKDFNFLLKNLHDGQPSWISQHVPRPFELPDTPEQWLIDGMILYHGVHQFSGKYGSMKTLLAQILSGCIAKGSDCFQRSGTGKGKMIVYVDKENPRETVRKRCEHLGLLDLQNFHIWGDWDLDNPPPESFDDARFIESACKDDAFFIFDSLSSLLNGLNESDPGEMSPVMNKLRRLARYGSGVIILHHSSKHGSTNSRGSTAIPAGTDMAFLVEKEGNTVTISQDRFRSSADYSIRIDMNFGNDPHQLGVWNYQVRPDGQGAWDHSAEENEQIQLKVEQARLLIENEYRRGVLLNQAKLAKLLGVTSGRMITKVLGIEGRPWKCQSGLGKQKGLLYYPLFAVRDGKLVDPQKQSNANPAAPTKAALCMEWLDRYIRTADRDGLYVTKVDCEAEAGKLGWPKRTFLDACRLLEVRTGPDDSLTLPDDGQTGGQQEAA